MSILSSTEYPAIRAALDTELDSNSLPDATIALNIYQAAADQDVIDRDPDAESRTGTEAARILRAAIYFCAARLTSAVIRITSLSIQARDMNFSKQTFKPEEKAAELRKLAEIELGEVLTPTDTSPNMPIMFAVATGRRGF